MIWEHPLALVLLALLPAIAWLAARARAPLGPAQRRLSAIAQSIAWLALVLAIAGPWTQADAEAPTRIAIALPGADQAAIATWRDATPYADPFYVIAAGARPAVGPRGDATRIPSAAGAPDLAAAIRDGLLRARPGAAADLAVFGIAGSAGAALPPLAESLTAHGARLHARTTAPRDDAPILLGVRHAARVGAREPFRCEVDVRATRALDAELIVRTGEVLLVRAQLRLRASRSATYLVDVPAVPERGVNELAFTLEIDGRTDLERQAERSAILADGSPRVLWLGATAEAFGALQTTLAPHGIELERGRPEQPYGGGAAADFDAVIVDDLPANAWPAGAQRELVDAILSQGTGLLLAGAHRSLGPGGYADTPLAAALPIDLPQREERRDPSVSVVLVIDTSGSMGNRVELAKEVARLAIRRLLPHDKVGIVEFYGSKRWAAPLQPASNSIELMRALNRMQAGGGTVIYSALEEGYYALLNAQTRFKHILVLTDGGVESGPFEALARQIAGSGINLSTVLIGPQANSPFLMSLSQWGRGRFYACPSRFQLPDLRFKEPQTTLMPAVQERPFAIEAADSESTRSLTDADLTIGGVVEARMRAGAEALVNVSDGGQPVLTGWDQGAGRVTVLATELLGPMADTIREHGWSTLIADQVRTLARGRQANRAQLAVDAGADALRITLTDAERPLWPNPVVAVRAPGLADLRMSLTPLGTDRFVAELPWPTDQAMRLEVDGTDLAGAARRPLPAVHRLRDVDEELMMLVGQTGGTTGGVLPVDAGAPAPGPARRALAPMFTIVALIAFLLALLARRWPSTLRVAPTALALLFLTPSIRAQDDPIQARIDQELRDTGNLARLQTEWRDGSPAQRLALAREVGDLDAVLALTDAGSADQRALRVLALDAKGEIEDALALIATILATPDLAPDQRAAWQLRQAELIAPRDQAAATLAFRAAAAAIDDPAFAHAVGHLAADYGCYDVALELHVAPPDATAAERATTHLRRALWSERVSDVDGALREYRAARAAATTRRERRFALSREIALMKSAGRLPELVDEWTAHVAELDVDEQGALLDALRELEQGDRALELLGDSQLRDAPELQDEAFAIAIESGRTDAAVARAESQLATDPNQPRLRVALALLLTDLRRTDDAAAALTAGMQTASRRELVMLVEAASELGAESAFRTGLARIREGGTERDLLDALLQEFQHLRRRQRNDAAVQLLLDARSTLAAPTSLVRLAEGLESAGRTTVAIELYREAYDATHTEDLALRLAWLLSSSKETTDRDESSRLFREIWLTAGSQARRVQAEERVLDLAARDGKLADLAIELEEALEDPSTEARDQKRDALVKIWTRAQDTFGAREVLLQWAREAPDRAIDAWQRLAQVYLENEEFKNNENALRHLIEIDPEAELDYRQQLALGFLERGRPVEARQVIHEMLSAGASGDAVALEFSAGIFSLAGRHRDAADLYRRALALHPDRIETLLLWANAMAAQQRGPEAVGRFVDILMQDVPDDLFLVAVDGLLNLEAPRPILRFAERALRRRIAAQPDKVFLQRALQDVLEQVGDEASRLRSLEETLLVAGLQRTAWLRELMDESARRRDWTKYLRDARALLRTGDEVPPAVFLEIGEALLKSDELRAAERAFSRARLATDFAKVENRIAELYERAGRIEDAERVRRRVLRRDPTDPGALVAVAQLVERRGDLPDALQMYRDAAEVLFDGQDLGAEEPASARSGNRNVTQSGPGFEAALEGVLRCASSAADTARLRDRITERLAEADATLKPPARLALIRRLRRVATAWQDDDAMSVVRQLEDAVLATPDLDGGLRAGIANERLVRGDLAGADAAIANADADAARDVRLRLALLRGDVTAALEVLKSSKPGEVANAARRLQVLGFDDALVQIRSDLAQRAEDDPDAARSAFDQVRGLLGETIDPRADLDEALARAFAAKGELRQRVSRIVSALRAHTGLTDAERGERLRPAIAEAVVAKDKDAAWTILSAARNWAAPEELAPLVPLLFVDNTQIYLVASRASFLDLVPPEEATKILRGALSKFPDAEVRSNTLRMLSMGELPEFLQAPLLSGLRFTELQPIDRTWLVRICCEADLPAATSETILRLMRRDLPGDPRTAMLAGRTATDPEERRAALREVVAPLSAESQPDYQASMLIEKFGALADATLRDAVLAEPVSSDAPIGALLLHATLLRSAERDDEAADLLLAAARRQPDNMMLLNEVQPLLQSLGRLDDAIAAYEAFVEQAAQVYPYQAGQLARLYLEAGRPGAAIGALRRTDDDGGSNLSLLLRAAIALPDPEARARELRGYVQQRQQAGRGRAGIAIMMSSLNEDRGRRHEPADVLAALRIPAVVPATADDALTDGDLLSFVPEGRAAAEMLLRVADDAQRERSLPIYRGLLGAAARSGESEPILARANAQLADRPFDAESLRIVLAAAQVGLPVDTDALDRALRQRVIEPRVDSEVLIELLWTAVATGRDGFVDRLLPMLLRDRGALSSYQLRDRIGDVLQLAATRDLIALRALGPESTAPNVYLDGDLLAVLVLNDPDPVALQSAFASVADFLSAKTQHYWGDRLGLPYAGLCARLGDLDGALRALHVDDPQTETGDLFPARCLAAAAPPLELWQDPELAVTYGTRIADAAAEPAPIGRRGVLLRVGFLLAIRLEAAGRVDAARELRAKLAPLAGSVPFVKPWLEAAAR